MPLTSSTPLWPGHPRVVPRADGEAARATLRAAVEALLIALLLRLFPRRSWSLRAQAPLDLPPFDLPPFDLPALDLPAPEIRPAWDYNIYGRAPHAAVVALGLVPDWILVGAPGRGMRAHAPAPPPHRHPQPARAPPRAEFPPRAQKPPPKGGRRLTPVIVSL
jgi:hypothetical protein